MIEKIIFFLSLSATSLLFSSQLKADETSDDLTSETYAAAKEFGFKDSAEIKKGHASAKIKINKKHYQNRVATAFDRDERLAGKMIDNSIDNILKLADGVLRARGEIALADDISFEYSVFYAGYVECLAAGCSKEIGDHPPINEWLDGVHKKIHDKIGDYWCQFFHIHDLEILNRGIPVVFQPVSFELIDYKDHFAGHMYGRFSFVHHGVAGVVTYWAVQVACSGATAGLGAASFFCGPISGFAEFVMDKNISPPLAERIWDRAHL